ncbi:MAG: hypothetical protein A2W93_00455 [Bacteroidetes bacterium GWF2_43_63]|nr:MAG: hypothetical protein A2W94_13065 [Bacteroidetes bacterium GWE2_42_42]OFY53875.1 MAG: hypothetical protein A2W93_00455 [Bacteroidetes bacterium GWF2_43_63]HBG69836.1 hypothetical protein [Bacteroidales bacterium]HCB60967.1 hypothetical protein [Bacteroidales bacterium]HCY24523.1 hypothetical protein [Bacteroidales bacterium]
MKISFQLNQILIFLKVSDCYPLFHENTGLAILFKNSTCYSIFMFNNTCFSIFILIIPFFPHQYLKIPIFAKFKFLHNE